jgi:WD40 repeat protein
VSITISLTLDLFLSSFVCNCCSICHTEEITSFDFHPTEACVAYGDKSGVIRLNYCLPGDAPKAPRPQAKSFRIDKYEWHTSPVSALKFAPDGHYLLSGAREVHAAAASPRLCTAL